MRRTLPALLVLSVPAALAAPALAQVAPPPGEKTTSEPYTPPPRPRPTATVPPQPQRPQRPERITLPDIERGTLVKRDAQGRVERLETSASVAALEINPMVTDELRPLIDEYLVERRKEAMERAVQYNDIARMVYNDGLIDTMDVGDRTKLEETLGYLHPLSMPGAEKVLQDDLSVFDDVAAEFNRVIANEYLAALQQDVIASAGEGDNIPQMVAREMFRDVTRDVMAAYHELMWNTGHLMISEQSLEAARPTEDQMRRIKPHYDRMLIVGREEQFARLAGEILDELNPEQQQAVLARTREKWRSMGRDL